MHTVTFPRPIHPGRPVRRRTTLAGLADWVRRR